MLLIIISKAVDTVHQIVDTIYINGKTTDVGPYVELIKSQHETYRLLITVFLGIITVIAGANFYYNVVMSSNKIKAEVDKIYKRDKQENEKYLKELLENELNEIKAETCRLFALNCNDTTRIGSLVNGLFWWGRAIKYYGKIDRGALLKVSIKGIKKHLDLAVPRKAEVDNYMANNYLGDANDHKKKLTEIIEALPDLVDEKKELINGIKKLFP